LTSFSCILKADLSDKDALLISGYDANKFTSHRAMHHKPSL